MKKNKIEKENDRGLLINEVEECEKVAVVSDVHWINDSVNVFKFIIPVQVKVFGNKELEKAKEWIDK